MSDTTDFWSGEFGDEYTNRNRVDWRKRIKFWRTMVDSYGFRSAYEVGCNAGYNLTAIKSAAKMSYIPYDIAVSGEDVNELALAQATATGLSVWEAEGQVIGSPYELVFTCGVLIHVAPEDLLVFMQHLIDGSCDLVLAVEYESQQAEEVEYRGHKGKLWKRPYGKLYQELGLSLVETGHAGDGFDNCTYWLLRKP